MGTRVCPQDLRKGRALRRGIVLAVLIALTAAAHLSDIALAKWAARYDQLLIVQIVGHSAYWMGLGGVQIGLAVVVAGGLWLRRNAPAAWLWTAAGAADLLAGLFAQVVKRLVGRARPRLDLSSLLYIGPTAASDYHSFPSGHSATSFAMAALLAVHYPRLATLFYALAAYIAAGRVLAGSHYLSDVLAGAVLGMATAWAVNGLFFRKARTSDDQCIA